MMRSPLTREQPAPGSTAISTSARHWVGGAHARKRDGVTLIEVIFAIGVILIGLVGLMAVLPLAGSRARSSVALNTGTAVADAAFNRLVADEMLRPGRLFAADGGVINFAMGTVGSYSESLCIDPVQAAINPSAADNGYNPDFFPHYHLNHNPLLDPSLPNDGSRTWPAVQPRLRRAGIQHTSGIAFNIEEALKLTDSADDLPTERPKDRTLNAFVKGTTATTTGVLGYGKRLQTGEYSWIATLNPQSTRPSERFATLSVVVFRNRDRGFVFPTTVAANPEANANSERLALVTEMRGFQGGAGGLVTLASAANTAANITENHWIMLSRFVPVPAGLPAQQVHRWYRVAGTDGDPEYGVVDPSDLGIAGAPSGTKVWRRRLLLDGSDWSFDPTNTYPTFATIAQGVVSVTERMVRIRNF